MSQLLKVFTEIHLCFVFTLTMMMYAARIPRRHSCQMLITAIIRSQVLYRSLKQFSLKKKKAYFYLKCRVTKEDREVLHLLIHSANGRNDCSWARMNPGVGTFFQVSRHSFRSPTWAQGLKYLGHPFCFPRHTAGS